MSPSAVFGCGYRIDFAPPALYSEVEGAHGYPKSCRPNGYGVCFTVGGDEPLLPIPANVLGQGSVITPPTVDPATGYVVGDAVFACGLREGGSFPSYKHNSVVPSVVVLGFPAGPHTVFSTVSSSVIRAFERHAFGALAHVTQESLEAVPPLTAHVDTARPVVGVPSCRWDVASGDHAFPRPVCSCSRAPVRSHSGRSGLPKQAPTRPRSASQVGRSNVLLNSTIANNTPSNLSMFVSIGHLLNHKPAEAFTRKIVKTHDDPIEVNIRVLYRALEQVA